MIRGPAGRHLVLLAASIATAALPLPAAGLLLARAPLFFWLPGAVLLGSRATRTALCGAPFHGAVVTLSFAASAALAEAIGRLGIAADALPHLLALLLLPPIALALVRSRGEVAGAPRTAAPPGGNAPGTEGAGGNGRMGGLRGLDLLAVTLAASVFVLTLVRGGTVAPGTDAGMQLSILSRAAATGLPLCTSPYFEEPVAWQYADAWHRLLASSVESPAPERGDLLGLWNAAPALVAVAAVLAAALLASELLPPVAAAIAIALEAAHLPLAALGFPAGPGRVLLMGGLGLGLAAVRARSLRLAAALALVAAGSAAIHPVESYLLAAGLGAWGVARALSLGRMREGLRPVKLALLVLLVAAPIVTDGNRFLLDQVSRREVIDPGNELVRIIRGIYVVHPRYWSITAGALLLTLALLAFPVVLRRSPEPARSFLPALAAVAALGLVFPPLAWVVLKLGLPTFLLSRAGLLFPAPLLVAAALAVLGIQRNRRLATACAALGMMPPLVRTLAPETPRAVQASHPVLGKEGSLRLEGLARGSVVLTDLWASDFLPVVRGHYAVAGITWHTASTRDQLATWDFFSDPHQPSGRALDLLRRRRVDAVYPVHWERTSIDWPGYGSLFYRFPFSDSLLADNPAAFAPDGRVRRPLPSVLAGKDVRPRVEFLAETRPLLSLGDFDVVGVARVPEAVRVMLRARKPTRQSPLAGVLAVPVKFDEHSPFARIVRAILGPRLTFALRRPPNAIRIDNRFYSDREIHEGERVDVRLAMEPPRGYALYVGPPEALPPFPQPLLPVLRTAFVRVPE